MAQNKILEVDGLRFAWVKGRGEVLQIPSLTLEVGEQLFLQGDSGTGKSTLLSVIAGIAAYANGSVRVAGQELKTLSNRQRDQFRADHLGYIFQQFNLLPYLSALENVVLTTQVSAIRQERCRLSPTETAAQLLTNLGIEAKLHRARAGELSVGQQQRVAAARALIGRPSLILADEPTSALDQASQSQFLELLIGQARASNASIIFVSHDQRLAPRFDRHINLAQINQRITPAVLQ